MDSINPHLLSYVSALSQRSLDEITMVVIHCTELPDLATAREYAEVIHYAQSATGNAGHFYVDRNGAIDQYVPLDRVAHHVAGHNQHTIGIELVNLGRFPDWLHSGSQQMNQPYPEPQIDALIRLVQWLGQRLPQLNQVAGHQTLDQRQVSASDNSNIRVSRKMDPGPLFPWERFLENIELTLWQG